MTDSILNPAPYEASGRDSGRVACSPHERAANTEPEPPEDPTPGAGALSVPDGGGQEAVHVGETGARNASDVPSSVYTENGDATPLTPEEQVNKYTAEAQSALGDWTFGGEDGLDGAELCRKLHGWYRSFLEEGFFPSTWKRLPIQMPRHIHLTLQRRDSRQLGYYRLGRSDTGTKFHININPNAVMRHKLSDSVVAAVLLHEALHLCEELGGRKRGGRYHTKPFRQRCDLVGIPCSETGAFEGITPHSKFDLWVAKHGVSKTFDYAWTMVVESAATMPRRVPWQCRCKGGPVVMVARGKPIKFECHECGSMLERRDSPKRPGVSMRLIRRPKR